MHEHPAQRKPADLAGLTALLLTDAGNTSARRASRTLISGIAQRVTLTAMLAGAELGEHASPPAASLQVLHGEVVLQIGDHRELTVRVNEIVAVPPQRHSLRAVVDSAILLTVAVD